MRTENKIIEALYEARYLFIIAFIIILCYSL